MKYKIILIILAVLITFGISLGIGYTLSNKSSKEDTSNVNTKKEEIINEQVVEENEINVDLPVEVDEKSIEKVEEELKNKVEENKKTEVNNKNNEKDKTILNQVIQ